MIRTWVLGVLLMEKKGKQWRCKAPTMCRALYWALSREYKKIKDMVPALMELKILQGDTQISLSVTLEYCA